MNIPDIRAEIFTYCNDSTLLILPLVDKLSYQILTEKTFWERVFNNNSFPYNNKLSYNIPINWNLEYMKTEICIKCVDNLIFNIKRQTLHYCLTSCGRWPHNSNKRTYTPTQLNGIGISVQVSKCNNIDIFNVPGLDFENLLFFYNKYLLNKLISENNIFTFSFNSLNKIKYSYSLSESSIKTILTRLLMHGILLNCAHFIVKVV
jgi:hypothetical protein